MEQLPLDVQLADYAVFDSFFPGSNGDLLHALRDMATRAARSNAWLWGQPGSGRTHLLQASVNAAAEAGFRAAYLPCQGLGDPGALAGLESMDLLCLDDVDQVAGDRDWERALFGIYEALGADGKRLLAAAGRPPLHVDFALPDLTSRFAAAATFRLRPLDDDDKRAALRLRAEWRGLDLPDDTAAWLMARVDRAPAELFALLDRLDRAALVQQRKLTVPFVRSLVENEQS